MNEKIRKFKKVINKKFEIMSIFDKKDIINLKKNLIKNVN